MLAGERDGVSVDVIPPPYPGPALHQQPTGTRRISVSSSSHQHQLLIVVVSHIGAFLKAQLGSTCYTNERTNVGYNDYTSDAWSVGGEVVVRTARRHHLPLLTTLLAPLTVCLGQLTASLGEQVARNCNTLSGRVAVALLPLGRGDNQAAVRANERELPARSSSRERLAERGRLDRLCLEVLRSAKSTEIPTAAAELIGEA